MKTNIIHPQKLSSDMERSETGHPTRRAAHLAYLVAALAMAGFAAGFPPDHPQPSAAACREEIQDGSFETPPINGSSTPNHVNGLPNPPVTDGINHTSFGDGSGAFHAGPWLVAPGGQVAQILNRGSGNTNPELFDTPAANGSQFLVIGHRDNTNATTLIQYVTLTARKKYKLTFWQSSYVSGLANGLSPIRGRVKVELFSEAGHDVANIPPNVPGNPPSTFTVPANQNWMMQGPVNITVQTSGLYALKFSSVTPEDRGPNLEPEHFCAHIDQVSFCEQP